MQYLSIPRTLLKETDSSKTVSMYTSSTIQWSSFLKAGNRGEKENINIYSEALIKHGFILSMIVNDKGNAT